MKAEDALPTFIAECGELLQEMEKGLLECTQGRATAETINLIFRAAHTIKGSSGLFGLETVVSFVHGVESTLDRVRMGKEPMDPPRVNCLLKCKDHIEALVAAITAGKPMPDPSLEARGRQLLDGLSSAATIPTAAMTDAWHLSLRFNQDVLSAGMDPLAFIRYLTTFGEIVGIVVVDDAVATLGNLDPQKCYLGFELSLRTTATQERIEAAFAFVREDCTLGILPPHSPIASYIDLLSGAALNDARVDALLIECESLTAAEVQLARGTVAGNTPSSPVLAPERPSPASGTAGKSAPSAEHRTLRVDASKLDDLITRIGELIIASASATLAARQCANAELEEHTSGLSALIEQVRESALQLRMVKIGATFDRFQRVVHDVSREVGKEIRLVVNGEQTELDKTVVERITDPLTHLVRNAIDHGIESAELRRARGKPSFGRLTLNARHESGSVVIEVRDDGGGLDRERILTKALERGLIEPGRSLSDAEVFGLVFEPGFSTAQQVTNLSGRGVGMDVVKRNITALRGSVNIQSAAGSGTTVIVRLPLTQAIINGFQVGVGASIFVLPLESVDECVEFSASGSHDFTSLRGEMLPFIRLREIFEVKGARGRRESIVVVNHAGRKAGLVVDSLLGESQTVIKPLRAMFQQVECVSGSSILGTGEVALILDVPALVHRAMLATRASAEMQPATAA